MTDTPEPRIANAPSRRGGKRPNAGNKPKPPECSLHQIAIYVNYDTLRYLQGLPRAEVVALKREAARVLSLAEINSRIIGGDE